MGADRGLAGTAGSYTPTTPLAWADPPPTTISDALDRLQAFASSVGSLLSNRVDGGTAAPAGATTTLTLDPITPTPGSNGNVEVSFFGAGTSSAASDQFSLQLQRDGVDIGPAVDSTADTNKSFPLNIGPFVDHVASGAARTYRLLVTNVTGGGHTVQVTAGYGLAQEVL